MESVSLSELTDRIQEVIKLSFDAPVWIHAEISELRENFNGHCYLELVEKENNTDNLLAKSKATIWNSTYRMLKPYFESTTGQTLRAGLNVLISVTVEFHGLYGFSLNVRDINPTYTIGEMAARRMKIMRQLEEDGIADMNKALVMPKLPQRLAVISSATAAGYGDFCDQLQTDGSGYMFYMKLFPAIMQGEQAEASIISALDRIYAHSDLFDVVVIIRGGGATTDLACFDSYELALNCAQFPLPIISGIGHQRDTSILDMIVHSPVKTPTAAAEFLLEKMKNSETEIFGIASDIVAVLKNKLISEQKNMTDLKWKIKQSLKNKVSKKLFLLERHRNRTRTCVRMLITRQTNKLQLIERNIESHSPAFLLKHGYTITTLNGQRITSISQIKEGQQIRTFVHDGDFESKIIQ